MQLSAQVRSLQQAADDVALGKVQLLGRIIKSFAQAEHPGAPLKALAQTLFNLPNGQVWPRKLASQPVKAGVVAALKIPQLVSSVDCMVRVQLAGCCRPASMLTAGFTCFSLPHNRPCAGVPEHRCRFHCGRHALCGPLPVHAQRDRRG